MPLSSASSEQRTHRSISKATAKKEGSIKMGSDPLAGAVQIVEVRPLLDSDRQQYEWVDRGEE
jgi:hypothetical protein